MMGLQTTATKRKREEGEEQPPVSPKQGRREEEEEARRQEGGVEWSGGESQPPLAPAPPAEEEEEEEDEEVEEEEEEEEDEEDEEEDEEEDCEKERSDQYLPAGRSYLLPSNPPTPLPPQCMRYGDEMGGSPQCYTPSTHLFTPPSGPHLHHPHLHHHPTDLRPPQATPYYGGDPADPRCPPPASPYCSRLQQPHPQFAPPQRTNPNYWHPGSPDEGYYPSGPQHPPPSPPSNQTIRCDENGKSYLELGSSAPCPGSPPPPGPQVRRVMGGACMGVQESAENHPANACCDRASSGRNPVNGGCCCYRRQRLAVLNISMCKLGRYRQFPDPSLHRSVLICNTLRCIEREMEREGVFFGNHGGGNPHQCGAPSPHNPGRPPLHPPPPPSPHPGPPCEEDEDDEEEEEDEGPLIHGHGYPGHQPQHGHQSSFTDSVNGYQVPYRCGVPDNSGMSHVVPPPYEQNLRELSATAPRATPFPSPAHPGSGLEPAPADVGGINWGSVLSLSSQSDLDPLNNNSLGELYPSPPSPAASSPQCSSPFTSPAHSSSSILSSCSDPSNTPMSSSSSSSLLLGDMDLGNEFEDFLPGWKLAPLGVDDFSHPMCRTDSSSSSHSSCGASTSSSSLSPMSDRGGGWIMGPGIRPPGEDLDNLMHVLVGT